MTAGGFRWLARKETPSVIYLTHLGDDQFAPYTEMGATTAEPLAIFPLPVDRRPGRDMDFCWQRCPFLTGLQYEDGTIDYAGIDLSEPTQEGPGIDFLLSYWMTAYLGV